MFFLVHIIYIIFLFVVCFISVLYKFNLCFKLPTICLKHNCLTRSSVVYYIFETTLELVKNNFNYTNKIVIRFVNTLYKSIF